MPINKDALARYRIIDRMLADPHRNYTTSEIHAAVVRECPRVTLRMIQNDIAELSRETGPFQKKLIRNAGGRGTVRYADQSSPLFYQELTHDEEEVLREAIRSLGQFEGLDNFKWLDTLKRKLSMPSEDGTQPLIVFDRIEGLRIPDSLLGRLFAAISRRRAIRIHYTKFGETTKPYCVYPYQLRQYNGRWYLICTPLGDETFPYNPLFVATFPLDRIRSRFDYLDDEPYLSTPVDLAARFEEVVGVTLYTEQEVEYIFFAASALSLDYVRTKPLHRTQIELDEASQQAYRARYPHLADCTFFTIECRQNTELLNLFASYAENVTLVEPASIRKRLLQRMQAAVHNYALAE